MKKFVEILDGEGAPTGTYRLEEATVLNVIDPSVPLDSGTGLMRAAGYFIAAALLT